MHDPVMPQPGAGQAKAAQSDLALRLEEVRARYPAIDTPAVSSVVRAVLAAVAGEREAHESSLLAEFEEVGRVIAAARNDVAALGADDIIATHIPAATDELDAVVAHTALATDQILEVCETLDYVAEGLADRNTAMALRHATTQIYEACSFQDITGQRIHKVTEALKAIDQKVGLIVTRLRHGAGVSKPGNATPVQGGVHLHGPQLPAAAMGQGDIDRLLASFE